VAWRGRSRGAAMISVERDHFATGHRLDAAHNRETCRGGFQTRLSLQTPLARYCQGCGASLKPAPYTFRDRCVTSRSVFVAPGLGLKSAPTFERKPVRNVLA